jgi:hypothetical protein
MRWWWAGVSMAGGVVVLAACSGSAGGGAPGVPSGSRSPAVPSTRAQTQVSSSAAPTPASSASLESCAAGRVDVAVGPGAAVDRRLCVRPGTVVSLVLRPRADDKRWTAAHSSAPVFVLVSGWQVSSDGTARASLRCAGTRAGAAVVGVSAKAPDVAGAARVAFTLYVSVVPYGKEG